MIFVISGDYLSGYFWRVMVFSKSFGYALRGILYIALTVNENERIQLAEIAEKLKIPRHFLGKVMRKLAEEGIINSMKGPYGGFSINEGTMETPLRQLINITGEGEGFNTCVLRLRKCNSQNPCPMHEEVELLRTKWQTLLASTTVGDLLKKEQPDFIRSIAVA